MTTIREAAQMALDALEEAQSYTSCETWSPSMTEECAVAAEALRAALAQPEQCKHKFEIDQEAPSHSCCQICGEVRKQTEQEPVALPDWFNHAFPGGKLEAFGFHMPTPRAYAEEMYKRWQRRFDELSAPPQREWQGLTDEEIESLWDNTLSEEVGITALRKIVRAIEAKLREKNDS